MTTSNSKKVITQPDKYLRDTMSGMSKEIQRVQVSLNISFFELFQLIEGIYDTCFLLESAMGFESDSQYAYIGFQPELVISARGYEITVSDLESMGVYTVDNPYRYLQSVFPHDSVHREFCGGLVGYLATESVNYIEPAVHLDESMDCDTFKFGVYTDGIVLNKRTGEIQYFYHTISRLDTIADLILQKKNTSSTGLTIKFLNQNITFEQHQKHVREVLQQINQGNVFQCEVGLRNSYLISGDKTILYKDLIKSNPSPYMFYLKFGDEVSLGSSPEMLFQLKNEVMTTKPLAGTVKRGTTATEDILLQRQLVTDPKERAEHLMLIDMHRNDIGKNAQLGSVVVTKEMEIVSFEHVHHLLSEILGIIRVDKDMFDGFAGMFPGGVLNGAPKIESIKIISSQEKEPRGIYGGAIGWFGFQGDCTFCIPIRSLFIKGDQGYIQACSGIVLDSDPKLEYLEVQHKLASLKNILENYAS
jgi:anthranilate synthase component I